MRLKSTWSCWMSGVLRATDNNFYVCRVKGSKNWNGVVRRAFSIEGVRYDSARILMEWAFARVEELLRRGVTSRTSGGTPGSSQVLGQSGI